MASKTLNTILSLQDNMSQKLAKVSGNFKGLSREAQQATLLAQKSLNNLGTKIEDIVTKAAKLGGKTLFAGLGASIGIGAASFNDYDEAIRQLQASTGSFGEELSSIMKEVYADNFGESWGDVANSISSVNKLIGGTKEEVIAATENAIAFRDTFGYEVNESTRAASTMMKQFGITSEEAYNLMAQGEQQGLDYSNELIDSINEYSVQFAKFGFTAEDMFNIFGAGAENGAWNLDKIGDAVKEFSIRAIDGSNTTIDGFTQLGMNADEMAKKFGAGGQTARDAFMETVNAIKTIDDPVKQSIIGVDLFGTMGEDLGPQVVTSMGNINEAFNKSKNTMEEINEIKYTSFTSALTGIKRQIESSLIPLGEKLVPIMNKFANWFKDVGAPKIEEFAGKVSEVMPTVFDAISGFVNFIIDHKDIIITIASMAATFTLVSKAVRGVTIAIDALKIAWAILNGTLLLSPVGMVIAGITVLVGVFVLAYQKSEAFRNMVQVLWDKILELGAGIMSWASGTILPIIQQIGASLLAFWDGTLSPFLSWCAGVLAPVFGGVWDTICQFVSSAFTAIGEIIQGMLEVFKGVIDFLTGVFQGNWSQAWEGIKGIFSGVVDQIHGMWSQLVNFLSTPVNAVVNVTKHVFGGGEDTTETETANNAVGTNYFSGGYTWVGEHGPELMKLPSGTQIKTNSQSNNMVQNSNVPPIQVIIQGNVIGNEQFADYIGNHVVTKVKAALNNM